MFFTVPVNDVAAAATTALSRPSPSSIASEPGKASADGRRWPPCRPSLQAGELVRWAGRPPARRGGRDHAGPSETDRYQRDGKGWVRCKVERVPARRTMELADDQELFDFGVLHRDPRPGRKAWVTAGRPPFRNRARRHSCFTGSG